MRCRSDGYFTSVHGRSGPVYWIALRYSRRAFFPLLCILHIFGYPESSGRQRPLLKYPAVTFILSMSMLKCEICLAFEISLSYIALFPYRRGPSSANAALCGHWVVHALGSWPNQSNPLIWHSHTSRGLITDVKLARKQYANYWHNLNGWPHGC